MTDLLDIQQHLQDTIATLSKHQSALASNPSSPILLMELQSLDKRKSKLEADFLKVANETGKEIFRYRLMPEARDLTVAGLASTLGGFQRLYSLFYDAITNGAKSRANVAADVIAKTTLNVGYVFPGSVGFALTVPNDRDLFLQSDAEKTIQVIRDASKSRDSSAVLIIAKKLGVAPIRSLYQWADDHVKHALGADIEWYFEGAPEKRLLIQLVEFKRLREVIGAMSDQAEETFESIGELKGADVSRGTFHLVTVEGSDIHGKSGDVISDERTVEVPKRYKARIRKTSKIHYSTEVEEVSYELLSLTPD